MLRTVTTRGSGLSASMAARSTTRSLVTSVQAPRQTALLAGARSYPAAAPASSSRLLGSTRAYSVTNPSAPILSPDFDAPTAMDKMVSIVNRLLYR